MEHTYTIEASSGSTIRWRMEARPSTTKRSAQRACSEEVSIQVIVELAESATEEQLDFWF